MAEVVQIPRTIGSAQKSLGAIEGLLTARNWEKSAIVAAFTYETAGRPKSGGNPSLLTITEFARLGITGLTDRETVRHYRTAWKTTVGTEVRPGQKVTLPEQPFPAWNPNLKGDPERREVLSQQAEVDGVGAGKVFNVAANPKAVATALKADPEFAKKVLKDPAVSEAVSQAMVQNLTDEADLKNPERAHASSDRPANRSEPPAKTVLRELVATKKAHEAHELVREVLEVWHLLSEDGKGAVMEEWEPMIREIEATRAGSFSDDELAAILREE